MNRVSSRTIRQAVDEAEAALRAAGLDTPRLDAELLACEAFECDRVGLRTRSHEHVAAAAQDRFAAFIERRLTHEPVQYILGVAHFRNLALAVDRRVLIPRPETELLVEFVLEHTGQAAASDEKDHVAVLDMCAGSGAVALAVADEAAGRVRVTGVDLSHDALAVAVANRQRLGLDVELLQGDLYAPVAGRLFDIVVSNPPYVPRAHLHTLPASVIDHEPAIALFVDEDDDIALVRRVIAGAPDVLRPKGVLAVEIGIGQHGRVAEVFANSGFEDVRVRRDLQGIERVVVGRMPRTREGR